MQDPSLYQGGCRWTELPYNTMTRTLKRSSPVLVAVSGNRIEGVAWGSSGQCLLWSLATGQLLEKLVGPASARVSEAFSFQVTG